MQPRSTAARGGAARRADGWRCLRGRGCNRTFAASDGLGAPMLRGWNLGQKIVLAIALALLCATALGHRRGPWSLTGDASPSMIGPKSVKKTPLPSNPSYRARCAAKSGLLVHHDVRRPSDKEETNQTVQWSPLLTPRLEKTQILARTTSRDCPAECNMLVAAWCLCLVARQYSLKCNSGAGSILLFSSPPSLPA